MNQPADKNWWQRNWPWVVPVGCLLMLLPFLAIAGIFVGFAFHFENEVEKHKLPEHYRPHRLVDERYRDVNSSPDRYPHRPVEIRIHKHGHPNEMGNEVDMGSHVVIVRPYSTCTGATRTRRAGKMMTHEFKSGHTLVRIQKASLIVNEMAYGKLSAGDDILVDHGEVSVNGSMRSGVDLTQAEVEALGTRILPCPDDESIFPEIRPYPAGADPDEE